MKADDVVPLCGIYYLTALVIYRKKLKEEQWWDFLLEGEFEDLAQITKFSKEDIAECEKAIKYFRKKVGFSSCVKWIENHHKYFFSACKDFFAAQLYLVLTYYYLVQLVGEAVVYRLKGRIIPREMILQAWRLGSEEAEKKLESSPEFKIDIVGHHKEFFVPVQRLRSSGKEIDFFVPREKQEIKFERR